MKIKKRGGVSIWVHPEQNKQSYYSLFSSPMDSFKKYLLSINHVPDTMLDVKDLKQIREQKQTDIPLCGLPVCWGWGKQCQKNHRNHMKLK